MSKLIKKGDSVVFAQRYLMNLDSASDLFEKTGRVIELLDEGETAVVDFHDEEPPRKVSVYDLEHIDESEVEDFVPYSEIEEQEDHDLGGMSRAQLIAHKILAQEEDPGLDRSINKLLD